LYAPGRVGIVYWVQRFGTEHRQGHQAVDAHVFGHGHRFAVGDLFAPAQLVASRKIWVLIIFLKK
jgi:hypothetical protein